MLVSLSRKMTQSSGRLFFQRMRQNWIYQYNVFKTIADWIIMLYIIVPFIIAVLVIYRSWWIELPSWLELIPFPLIFILLFFFTWGGHFRTFIRDADRIFLMKNRPLYMRLKQITILFSFVAPILQTTMIGLLIAPFWLKLYQLNAQLLLLYLCLFLSSKWL